VEVGGIPNIVKDSRLTQAVVRACYPDYDQFRHGVRAFDRHRTFKSELSERLEL
jgi:decaprenylphospho-beta-D-ribofuranose 2-oxidase